MKIEACHSFFEQITL